MRTLKATAVLMLFITMITACSKKDGSEAPEPPPEPVNLGNYYIAGKYTLVHEGKSLSLPYAIYFGPNSKAYTFLGSSVKGPEGEYQLKDGSLLINFEFYGGLVFTIAGDSLTNYSGKIDLTSYSLEKIPATNAFPGNYKGGLSTSSSTQISLATLSFTKDEFAFGGSFNYPDPDTEYILINNGLCTGRLKSSPTYQLFVFIKGKLETSGYHAPDTKYNYGSFAKQ